MAPAFGNPRKVGSTSAVLRRSKAGGPADHGAQAPHDARNVANTAENSLLPVGFKLTGTTFRSIFMSIMDFDYILYRRQRVPESTREAPYTVKKRSPRGPSGSGAAPRRRRRARGWTPSPGAGRTTRGPNPDAAPLWSRSPGAQPPEQCFPLVLMVL